jgi:hypothetical protein
MVSTLVRVVDAFLVVQFNRDVLSCLEVREGYVVVQFRQLGDEQAIAWGRGDF